MHRGKIRHKKTYGVHILVNKKNLYQIILKNKQPFEMLDSNYYCCNVIKCSKLKYLILKYITLYIPV